MLGESWIDVECQNLYVFGEGRIDFETIKWVGNFLPTTLRMIPFSTGMLTVENLQKHTQNDPQIISLSYFVCFYVELSEIYAW